MEKLPRDILRILKDKEFACEFNEVKSSLFNRFRYEQEISNQVDIFSSKVRHQLSVLENDGFVKMEKGQDGRMRFGTFYSLYTKGYEVFDPWYKKFWRFFTDDLAKILSVISMILSIIAVIISLMTNE